MLPETWESSRCLGAQISWTDVDKCGRILVPNSCGSMGIICGRIWTPNMTCVWASSVTQFLGFHMRYVATLLCVFHGCPRHVEMGVQNGCAHHEAPMPRTRGNAHFDATTAHETFHAPALPHAPSFSEIFRKNVWKSTSYNPIFATSEIDIGRCSRLRQRVH